MLIAEARVLLDKDQIEDVDNQLAYVIQLVHTGHPVTKQEERAVAEIARAVMAKKSALVKFSPPKAPEMTVLAADFQEPHPAYVPCEVEPSAPAYQGPVPGADHGAPGSAQDFREGV
jgi:hypothetical protein